MSYTLKKKYMFPKGFSLAWTMSSSLQKQVSGKSWRIIPLFNKRDIGGIKPTSLYRDFSISEILYFSRLGLRANFARFGGKEQWW
jgi:hypothetical protein